MKLLEENIGKTFSVSQGYRNKNNNKQMRPSQTEKFLLIKGNHKKMQWEKILTNNATNKGLISKIYKQLNSKIK